MNMRTPLADVRGLGAARSGTHHFWMQRLTSVASLPLVVYVLWFILGHLGSARSEVVASLHNPLIGIALILAFLAVLWHMQLGMRVIIEDYVHAAAAKVSCLILNSFYCATLGALAFFSILSLSLGS